MPLLVTFSLQPLQRLGLPYGENVNGRKIIDFRVKVYKGRVWTSYQYLTEAEPELRICYNNTSSGPKVDFYIGFVYSVEIDHIGRNFTRLHKQTEETRSKLTPAITLLPPKVH